MRQLLTIGIKGRLSKSDIRSAWQEFEKLRADFPPTNFFVVGEYRDLQSQRYQEVWVDVSNPGGQETATMRFSDEV